MLLRRKTVAVILIVPWVLAGAQAFGMSKAKVEKQFRGWIKTDLRQKAIRQGISKATFDRTMKSVSINWKLPDLIPPGTKPSPSKSQSQAEFGSPAPYFAEKRVRSLAASGRSLAGKYKATLRKIERKYGVPGRIIVAIWGRESAFGRAKIPHNAMNILATRAFMSRRKALFEKELLAALVMIDKKLVTPAQMKSSWAGAMGQPQFLPSSYLEHAVDFDGDGKANIWTSVPDTLASIANYLKNYGWQRGRDWGFEATLPQSISCALEGPDRMRTVAEWSKAGARRISGKAFPQSEMAKKAAILFPAGRKGPVFLATPNFYVIKKYNNSDLYALFVGNVADRIEWGGGTFKAGWKKSSGLTRGNVTAMQNRLIDLGYDVGGADGFAGFKTRRSIGDWQTKNGMTATCWPDSKLAKRLK